MDVFHCVVDNRGLLYPSKLERRKLQKLLEIEQSAWLSNLTFSILLITVLFLQNSFVFTRLLILKKLIKNVNKYYKHYLY